VTGRYDVADPRTGTIRQCATKCDTCVFHPGNRARLAPGRLAALIASALAAEGHIVCHSTIGTAAPAICAGYADHPQGAARSIALRCVRLGLARLDLVTPPTKGPA
jgi:hypothetical protein